MDLGPLLFISDLHLAPERPEVTQAFFDFLQHQALNAEALYILGDLFEAWIGDDDPSPLARDVIGQLRALSNQGVKLYFQHGNRDFLVGKRFARETGCTLLPDCQLIEHQGQRILLLHGDSLCLDDVDYQKFRRKVRHPIYRFLLRSLPLKKRIQIATDWREKSRQANSNKASNIMDVTPAEVDRLLDSQGATLMIHGHTHRPARHQHANGERVVLGDWHNQGWYFLLKQNGEQTAGELISFDIE